jgi:hypothetical protein
MNIHLIRNRRIVDTENSFIQDISCTSSIKDKNKTNNSKENEPGSVRYLEFSF